jgi:hypothetical protein
MSQRRIPVVMHLTPAEHAALVDFVSKITNETTPPSVARYLVIDYLVSELGYDLPVPRIEG